MRLPQRPDADRRGLNWVMHWGQGILLGATRGLMAERELRGPVGSFLFLNIRLLNDQTLENATGVGAPPWTWPVDEQAIDLLHKGSYAYATGIVADLLWRGRRGFPRRASPGGCVRALGRVRPQRPLPQLSQCAEERGGGQVVEEFEEFKEFELLGHWEERIL